MRMRSVAKPVKFDFKGGKELQAAFAALGDKEMLRRMGLGALDRGAEPIRDDAIDRAAEDKGVLKRAIKIGENKLGRKFQRWDKLFRWVGIDSKVKSPRLAKKKRTKRGRRRLARGSGVAAYSIFVEKGTSDTRAQPFMRPAYESKKHEAVRRIGVELWRAIDIVGRRRAKLAARLGHNGGPPLD